MASLEPGPEQDQGAQQFSTFAPSKNDILQTVEFFEGQPLAGTVADKEPAAWTFCCWWRPEMPVWLNEPIYPKWPRLTRAMVLGILNGVACVFHVSLTLVVVFMSIGLPNWAEYGGVQLPLYKAALNWTVSDPGEGSAAFELVPSYIRQESSINLTSLTIAFFGLSAFFHALIVAASTRWTIYFWWIDSCRQPLRYASPRPRTVALDARARLHGSSVSDGEHTLLVFQVD